MAECLKAHGLAHASFWFISTISRQRWLPAFKFFDDVNVIEVIDSTASTRMQTSVDEIVTWSTDNHMNINTSKNEEMII